MKSSQIFIGSSSADIVRQKRNSLWHLVRFDGFEAGLNSFHIQTKAVAGTENIRKSPPNKKTKKAAALETGPENKFGESADKFMFLG